MIGLFFYSKNKKLFFQMVMTFLLANMFFLSCNLLICYGESSV